MKDTIRYASKDGKVVFDFPKSEVTRKDGSIMRNIQRGHVYFTPAAIFNGGKLDNCR